MAAKVARRYSKLKSIAEGSGSMVKARRKFEHTARKRGLNPEEADAKRAEYDRVKAIPAGSRNGERILKTI